MWPPGQLKMADQSEYIRKFSELFSSLARVLGRQVRDESEESTDNTFTYK